MIPIYVFHIEITIIQKEVQHNFLPRIQTSFLQPFPETAEGTIENMREGERQTCKEVREANRRPTFPYKVSHTALT